MTDRRRQRTVHDWRRDELRRDPTKARARRILRDAVDGRKLRRQPCRDCGAQKAHGHHPDYSQPLEVVWLCRQCHDAEHERLGKVLATQCQLGHEFTPENTYRKPMSGRRECLTCKRARRRRWSERARAVITGAPACAVCGNTAEEHCPPLYLHPYEALAGGADGRFTDREI